MIAVITMFWWIGLAFITMYGLVLEFGLVSEFVNPILTWILVMVFGIPFMPILPVFAVFCIVSIAFFNNLSSITISIFPGRWILSVMLLDCRKK